MRILVSLSALCILLIPPSASADFVGVTTVIKDDPETDFQCTQAGGDFVFFPLTVCNVYATFDLGSDKLLAIGNSDLQVMSGGNPGLFYQHPFGNGNISPSCDLLPIFPDLRCDSFVTIGVKCNDGTDQTSTDPNFDSGGFNGAGHVAGGWFNANPPNGQGDAGQGDAGQDPSNHTGPDPPNQNLPVLFLQASVEQGNSMEGELDIFWQDSSGDIISNHVAIECAAKSDCGDCPTDVDGSGNTDAFDLANLLDAWGPCSPGDPCVCLDADANGSIDASDLAVLLDAWGPCP